MDNFPGTDQRIDASPDMAAGQQPPRATLVSPDRARPIWIITALLLGVMALVTLAEIGFIVAFGVLPDTFVVRSVLVPALVMDFGPAWWWLSALWKQEHSAVVTEEPVREVAAA